MHRPYRTLLIALLMVGVMAGCGDDSGGGPDGVDAAAVAAEDGAYPATIEHKHGSTTISEAPERIVTVGLSDHDFVLAFGAVPVAVTYWYGDYESATWPWAQEALGDANPTVLNDGQFTGTAIYNFEQISALEPDLIIGLYTDMNESQYQTLSAIAPTIGPSADYPEYGMPWQETTKTVGAALGLPTRAEELIDEVDAQLAAAAADHPEFNGQQMVVAELFDPGSSFARSPTDPRTKLMTSLGFELPEEIASLAGDRDGAEISDEQMGLLDHDLLVWNVGYEPELRADIESKPLYSQLEVVKAGRSIFIEDPLISGALTWGTVLSLPYAIEHLVPQLAAAL